MQSGLWDEYKSLPEPQVATDDASIQEDCWVLARMSAMNRMTRLTKLVLDGKFYYTILVEDGAGSEFEIALGYKDIPCSMRHTDVIDLDIDTYKDIRLSFS